MERSSIPFLRVILAAASCLGLFVAGRSAEAAPAATLGYYGGPVISPHIKPFYWGVIGASDTNTLQTYLQHLADYMSGVNLAPGTEPVVRQYGVWGAIVDPPVIDTTPPSSTVTGPSIEAELNAKGVTFDPQTLVVVFTNTSRVPSTYGVPGGWCGFHSNFGTGKYYAHIPSPFLNCSPVGLQGTMKKWQLETSHEIFEAATDPLLNAWHTSAGGSTGEGADGDECNPTTYPSMAGIGVVTPFEDNKAALSNGGAAVCNLNAREQYTPINAVSRGPNLLDVFYEGQDHALWHKRFNGTGWEAAHSLNGQLAGAPAAVALDPNTLHVLVIGTTRYLHDMVWTNAGGWAADYVTVGGGQFIGNPTVMRSGSPRIEAVAQTINGSFNHTYFDGAWEGFSGGPSSGSNTNATTPPTLIPDLGIGVIAPNVLFGDQNGNTRIGYANNNPPVYSYSDSGVLTMSGGRSFAPMGGCFVDFGALFALAVGTDNHLYANVSPQYQEWDGWGPVGLSNFPLSGSPAVVYTATNTVQAFVIGANSAMYQTITRDAGATWHAQGFDFRTAFYGTPTAVSWQSPRVDAFAKGGDDHVWHMWSNDGTSFGVEEFTDTLVN